MPMPQRLPGCWRSGLGELLRVFWRKGTAMAREPRNAVLACLSKRLGAIAKSEPCHRPGPSRSFQGGGWHQGAVPGGERCGWAVVSGRGKAWKSRGEDAAAQSPRLPSSRE